jgi:hypothetical protein
VSLCESSPFAQRHHACKAEHPASTVDFPFSLILLTIPKEPSFSKIPSRSDKVAYGKYSLISDGNEKTQTDLQNPVGRLLILIGIFYDICQAELVAGVKAKDAGPCREG